MRSGRPHPMAAARGLTVSVLAIAAASWAAMALWHGHGTWSVPAPDPGHTGAMHAAHGHSATVSSLPAALWLAGWVVMVLAMMLPTALPFLREMSRLLARRSCGGALVATGAVGFILAWTLAGAALLAAGHLLGGAFGHLEVVSLHPSLLAGAAALLAGAYQFTGLKRACLAACRSPAAMVLARWRAERPWRAAAAIGLRYGLVCVGCCWAMMALGLVVGVMSLPIMMVTAVMMAAERMLPSVRPLIPLQAAFAAAIGLLLLVGALQPAASWP